MRRRIAFLAIFAVGCSTLAASVLTLSHRNPELDFNKYKTYAITSPPIGENDNRVFWDGLKNQIRTEMQTKGYQELKGSAKADLWIVADYSTSFQHKYNPVQPEQGMEEGGGKPEVKFSGEHLYAHLALRLYDPALHEYTWQSITYMDSTDKLNTKSWNINIIGKLMSTCPYSGTYGGVGMKFDSQLEIKEMFAGSPAQAAGILVGDKIQAVNGIDITNYQQCVNMLKGEAGTKLKIVVGRVSNADSAAGVGLRPLEFTLQRMPVNNFYLHK